jgi:hypothetical protein
VPASRRLTAARTHVPTRLLVLVASVLLSAGSLTTVAPVATAMGNGTPVTGTLSYSSASGSALHTTTVDSEDVSWVSDSRIDPGDPLRFRLDHDETQVDTDVSDICQGGGHYERTQEWPTYYVMPATPGQVEGGAGSASTLWVSGGTQTEVSDGGCRSEHTWENRYQAIYEGTLDTAGLAPGCYELDSPHFSLAAYLDHHSGTLAEFAVGDATCSGTSKMRLQLHKADGAPAGGVGFTGVIAGPLLDGEMATALVDPGSHQVLLADPTAWVITGGSCDDADSAVLTGMPGGAGYVVVEGEVVTCDVTVAANQPPVAVDDSLSVPGRDSACVAVLANDHDPEGQTIGLVSWTQPPHQGTVTRQGDDLCYEPAGDYWGPDSFTYVIADARGATATATVQVDVARYCDPAYTSAEVVAPILPALVDTFSVSGSIPWCYDGSVAELRGSPSATTLLRNQTRSTFVALNAIGVEFQAAPGEAYAVPPPIGAPAGSVAVQVSGDFSMDVNLFDLATSVPGLDLIRLEATFVRLAARFGPEAATTWLRGQLTGLFTLGRIAHIKNPALYAVITWLGGPVGLAGQVAQLLADRWLHVGCFGSCTTVALDAGRVNLVVVLHPDGSAAVDRHWIDLGLPVMGPTRLVSFTTHL